MKTYKDFNKKFIGESDIASLTLRSETSCAALNFGMDAAYMAYIVTEEAEIGSHYKLIFEGKSWLKIFDDTELTFLPVQTKSTFIEQVNLDVSYSL